jgi:hypothetical protein
MRVELRVEDCALKFFAVSASPDSAAEATVPQSNFCPGVSHVPSSIDFVAPCFETSLTSFYQPSSRLLASGEEMLIINDVGGVYTRSLNLRA